MQRLMNLKLFSLEIICSSLLDLFSFGLSGSLRWKSLVSGSGNNKTVLYIFTTVLGNGIYHTIFFT